MIKNVIANTLENLGKMDKFLKINIFIPYQLIQEGVVSKTKQEIQKI